MNDPSRLLPENLLSISWHDSHWIPLLGPHNVMDYFSERTNPFYDRTCNNEVLKMQRASLDQLPNMQGVEYCLLYVQEPILYVIRKQHRNSPTHVTPIADYYIIAGIVYQAPDMGSVLNSRILSSVCHLQSAFEEARSYARYHPSKGYWWDFNKQTSSGAPPGAKVVKTAVSAGDKANKKPAKSKEERFKEEPSSLFQRRRVDVLLDLLTRKFPPKVPNAAAPPPPPPPASASSSSASVAAATSTGSSSTSSSAAATTAPPDQKPDTKELPVVSAPAVKSEPDSRGIKREASGGVSQAQDAKRLKL